MSRTEGSGFGLAITVAESRRNTVASRWLSTVRLALAVAIGLGIAAATITEVAAIEDRYASGVEAGRFVWRATGITSEASVDVARCEALGAIGGVRSAGAALSAITVIVSNQPQARYELAEVSAGYPSIIWPGRDVSTPTGGAIVGDLMARNLGLVPGATVRITEEEDPTSVRDVTVDRVMPPSPRDEGADRRLLLIAPARGVTDECLVDPEPASSGDVGALIVSWFSASTGISPIPYLIEDALARTPEDELSERLSAWAWPIGAGFLAAVTGFIWYGRRDESALYRLLGMTRASVVLMHFMEHFTVTVVPVQVGYVAALIWRQSEISGIAGRLALLDNVCLLAALSVVPLICLLWLRGRSTLDILKGY